MPQSSRVMVTRAASARHRASSGGAAAVRRRSERQRGDESLRIRQGLLRLAPARKQLRAGAVEQFVGVADA